MADKDILIIPASGSIEFTGSAGNNSILQVEDDASLNFNDGTLLISSSGVV